MVSECLREYRNAVNTSARLLISVTEGVNERVQYFGDDGRQDAAAVFQRSGVRHRRDADVVISGQQRTCRHSSHRGQVANASRLDQLLLILSIC